MKATCLLTLRVVLLNGACMRANARLCVRVRVCVRACHAHVARVDERERERESWLVA